MIAPASPSRHFCITNSITSIRPWLSHGACLSIMCLEFGIGSMFTERAIQAAGADQRLLHSADSQNTGGGHDCFQREPAISAETSAREELLPGGPS